MNDPKPPLSDEARRLLEQQYFQPLACVIFGRPTNDPNSAVTARHGPYYSVGVLPDPQRLVVTETCSGRMFCLTADNQLLTLASGPARSPSS